MWPYKLKLSIDSLKQMYWYINGVVTFLYLQQFHANLIIALLLIHIQDIQDYMYMEFQLRREPA